MATRQKLKGDSTKLYDIIENFGGINTSVADDVTLDNTFRRLTNFYGAEQGTLSKRPGVYDTQIGTIFRAIYDNNYNPQVFEVDIADVERGDIGKKAFDKMVTMAFKGEALERGPYTPTETTTTTNPVMLRFIPRNLLNYTVTRDIGDCSKFLLQADKMLNEGLSGIDEQRDHVYEFIMIIGGETQEKPVVDGPILTWSTIGSGLAIFHVRISLISMLGAFTKMFLFVEEKDPTWLPYEKDGVFYPRWTYDFRSLEDMAPYERVGQLASNTDTIELAKYNGYYYAATGTNYILKLKEALDEYVPIIPTNEESTIIQIGGYTNNSLYKPTPIEVNYVGFNILANNPITYYDRGTGSTSIIKGIFYTVGKTNKKGEIVLEPVQTIPFNKPFQIHVIYTGSTLPTKFEYRLDNGDTDTSTNPYKALSGHSSNVDGELTFNCDGLNDEGKFELKVSFDNNTINSFINYFQTGTSNLSDVGLVSDIDELVLSSTKCKIVGNQLVLFGGHGYMFFSEFDKFDYFPNYNYIYIANSNDEEVTNITYFRQFYAIFTNKKIKRMAGTFGSSNFGVYPLNDFIGCSNGSTVRPVHNNLYFVGNDGLYQLKQGYLGEGTENVERLDLAMPDVINAKSVLNAYVLGDYYIMAMNDGKTWYIININTQNISHFELSSDSSTPSGRKSYPFSPLFSSNLYDIYGGYVNVARYDNLVDYTYGGTRGNMNIMQFRFDDLDFLDYDLRHKDQSDFISEFETPAITLGTPTHTKKFKALYFKFTNKTGTLIPLFISVYVDDVKVLSPEDYEVVYDDKTNTYYYVYTTESNASILEGAEIVKSTQVLGELTLGEDVLGNKTTQQLKLRPNFKGRSIKFVLADGYNEVVTENGVQKTIKHRNNKDFTLSVIGIVYKLKKVKEG